MTSHPHNPQIVNVSAVRIREIFNTSQHATSIENGEYLEVFVRDDVLQDETARKKNLPLGTRSQYLRYFNLRRQWMVEIHRYLQPDGTLGASGRPDPKRVNMGDVIYKYDPELD